MAGLLAMRSSDFPWTQWLRNCRRHFFRSSVTTLTSPFPSSNPLWASRRTGVIASEYARKNAIKSWKTTWNYLYLGVQYRKSERDELLETGCRFRQRRQIFLGWNFKSDALCPKSDRVSLKQCLTLSCLKFFYFAGSKSLRMSSGLWTDLHFALKMSMIWELLTVPTKVRMSL